jgi:hypothetical protein
VRAPSCDAGIIAAVCNGVQADAATDDRTPARNRQFSRPRPMSDAFTFDGLFDNESTALPSLVDDAAFLAELDRLEVRGISRPVATPLPARDANRWNLCPPRGVDPEPPVPQHPQSAAGVWLPILVGLSVGAAASAAVFHERVAQILVTLVR